VAVVAVLLASAACSGGAPSPPNDASTDPEPQASPSLSTEPVELTVFGAASLKGALERVKTVYEAAHPGLTVTLATDSSVALRTQIEQGAPADVYLSADTTNAQALVDAGLADGLAVPFAGNVLTIIVPPDNPAGIETPADLARTGVKIVAAGDEVPIARYAAQAVGNLARLDGYPADFAAAYAANIVSREDNVKAVVAKIELGEGDAGIVYATDAAASESVSSIEIPADANVPASYAGVVVGATRHADAARSFLDWIAGPDGQAILAEFGFLPPP
jgi:molybdate transport system substrate-binding protein